MAEVRAYQSDHWAYTTELVYALVYAWVHESDLRFQVSKKVQLDILMWQGYFTPYNLSVRLVS